MTRTTFIADITLDEKSVLSCSPEIEQEKRIAIRDLVRRNQFVPVFLDDPAAGPFNLNLSVREGALNFALSDAAGSSLGDFFLPLKPFSRLVRRYFTVCESYFTAVRDGDVTRIETIDMGRRGLHDEAAGELRRRLQQFAEVDEDTARRLFTLLCVLQFGRRVGLE